MSKLKTLTLGTSFLAATLLNVVPPARAALINTFSFDNESGSPAGGTVTGTIIFDGLNPDDSATGVAADRFMVDSLPPGFGDSDNGDNFDVGINLLALATARVETNLFDLVNGTIIAADFGIFDEDPIFAFNGVCLGGTGARCASQASFFGGGIGASTATFNEGFDLAGDINSNSLTFISQSSRSVPEPSCIQSLVLISSFAVASKALSRLIGSKN
jgi:hypothetical protein